jgi:DNA repair exonuclease SbcCD ATPase subunit
MAARTDDVATLQKQLDASDLRCFSHVNNTEALSDMTQAPEVRKHLDATFQERKMIFKPMRASEAALEALAQEQRLPGVDDVRNASIRLTAEVEEHRTALEETKQSCASAEAELDASITKLSSTLAAHEKQRMALATTADAHARQVDVLLPRLAQSLGMFQCAS